MRFQSIAFSVVVPSILSMGCAPEIPRRPEGSDGRLLVNIDGGSGIAGLEAGGAPPTTPPGKPPTTKSPPGGPKCGNGELEAGETCDGAGKSCVSIDPGAYVGGTATCRADCKGYNLGGCKVPPTKPTLSDALKVITEGQLKKDLTVISSDAHNGRYPGSPGDKQTRAYVKKALASAGLKYAPGIGSYEQSFTWSGRQTANVIGVLPGNHASFRSQVVVIGGHHDHLGTTSHYGCKNKGGNSICNGADDNGTGTVAVMAIARALSKLKGQNRRTLVFMAFGAEEKGLVGSKYYVNNASYPLSKTVYMINIDMIGYSSGSVKAMGAGRSKLASKWIAAAASASGITHKITNLAGSGSDHYYFALKKVPYVYFHTGLPYCYHGTCDTVGKIHFKELAQITRLVARFMWKLSQSDQNPRTDFAMFVDDPEPVIEIDDWRYFTDYIDHADGMLYLP